MFNESVKLVIFLNLLINFSNLKDKIYRETQNSDVVRSDNDSDELESGKGYPYFRLKSPSCKRKFAHNALNVEKYIEAAIHTTDRRLLKRQIEQEIETIEDNNIIVRRTYKRVYGKSKKRYS